MFALARHYTDPRRPRNQEPSAAYLTFVDVCSVVPHPQCQRLTPESIDDIIAVLARWLAAAE
ncbi:MAG: hypothetical protein WCJ35_16285 [Planctomycetota bacterium]